MLAIAACGASGALTYSFPTYIKAVSKTPPVPFAAAVLGFSLFVGSICAVLFTGSIGFHWPWTVQPEPWPLAMVIGLSSNPLVPKVIQRLETWVDTFGGKS